MHILTVIGARPQFIKAAVVSHAISEDDTFRETLVHTGQHFDKNMSDIFFSELGIPTPRFNLDIHGGTHGKMTGRMLEQIEQVILEEKPDCVLVYGDTNSTLAGALAASKLHVKVAHVEAGLRSFNMKMPEEVNRILTDHVSDILFAPSETAASHLRREGVSDNKIHLIGDVMYDVALHFGKVALQQSTILDDLGLNGNSYILGTIHRAENTDQLDRLKNIIGALSVVASEIPVILPLHPRTRQVLLQSKLLEGVSPSLRIIEPVGYLDMVRLEIGATLIATDSGGVQKEAFFHSVPCVTLRDETEWVELIDAGWNRLAIPSSIDQLANQIHSAIGTKGADVKPYGDGRAAFRVVEELKKMFG